MALTGEPYTTAVQRGGLYPCKPSGLYEFHDYSARRAELQYSWLKYWASTAKKTKSQLPIDAIICPMQSSLPRPHDTLIRSHYTRNWNVLDYPAAVIQCGFVDLEKDSGPLPTPKGELDIKVQSTYTLEKRHRYANFPVGLQLVGQRQMEQKLMSIALAVDKIVRP